MFLVDTSVWIECFQGKNIKDVVSIMLDNGEVCTNDVVIAVDYPAKIICVAGTSSCSAETSSQGDGAV